ncbi:arylamine N-acetyltransferase 1 [Aspergillus sp. HF37]|nr:arylamine N-acetyltransferase 1 [Aspergillus sp. HF37]
MVSPAYTTDQLEAYLERIGLSSPPGSSRVAEVKSRSEADPLATLADLQRRHLCAIPWGNSGLHYTQHHTISIHPQTVFEKLVQRRLDGYCMENTNLFFVVLRCLGYQVYATGGRVSHATATGVNNGLYLALGHMILIVTIAKERYMVDVGFGSGCATSPLPLQEDAVATNIAPSEMRLVKESLLEISDKSQKVWVYQTRHSQDSDWIPNICFTEAEFLPQDFGVMNFSVSQSPTSWFTQVFVCMRMIMDESESEIKGQCIMSGREVKRRVRGQTEVLETLESEDHRVKALARWFDMHFREDEVQAIRGMVSMIR